MEPPPIREDISRRPLIRDNRPMGEALLIRDSRPIREALTIKDSRLIPVRVLILTRGRIPIPDPISSRIPASPIRGRSLIPVTAPTRDTLHMDPANPPTRNRICPLVMTLM